MSMHEWNDVMYGVELPKPYPDNDKILAFINNHKDALSGFNSSIEFPKTADDVTQFIDDYDDECGYTGLNVIISDLILIAGQIGGNKCICAAQDEYGNEYVGIYASNVFPWNNVSDEWKSITPESIENSIKPLVEELYGMCPEFDEHVIWNYG